jgi:hypothetical protein
MQPCGKPSSYWIPKPCGSAGQLPGPWQRNFFVATLNQDAVSYLDGADDGNINVIETSPRYHMI